MQSSKKELAAANLQVIAISYDKVDVLKRFGKQQKVDFPLLSDPDSKTIEAFGLRNVQVKGSRIDGVPHPGTFIVDAKGIVRAKLFHEGYKKRHLAKELIDAANSIAVVKKNSDQP